MHHHVDITVSSLRCRSTLILKTVSVPCVAVSSALTSVVISNVSNIFAELAGSGSIQWKTTPVIAHSLVCLNLVVQSELYYSWSYCVLRCSYILLFCYPLCVLECELVQIFTPVLVPCIVTAPLNLLSGLRPLLPLLQLFFHCIVALSRHRCLCTTLISAHHCILLRSFSYY